MKLLILTQKVDENDDVLGFFHGWIAEFAKYCESITVICLQKGEYHLPENVRVLSLGKESGYSRPRYAFLFYKYIWQERKNYESVFVHMNQEYVLLGAIFWKFFGKKVTMWRNHAKGNWVTRIAVFLSDTVFCTSPQSFTAQFEKTKVMPVGIDTDFFKPDPSILKKRNSILFLGRIAPVKNVDIFIEALRELKSRGMEFYATIAGGSSDKDAEYEKMIRDKVVAYGLGDAVTFTGSVSRSEALKLYREHELYVNLTPSGSMDKTIFEAMACETMVLASNANLQGQVSDLFLFNENDEKDLAEKARTLLFLDAQTREKYGKLLREYVVKHHSLKQLAGELMIEIKK